MDAENVSSPHDRMFREAFSRPELARELLSKHLPPRLRGALDLMMLEQVEGSLIDDHMALRESDLLFRTRFGDRQAFIYLLLEHQSTVDQWMPLRLLGYILRIWERFRRDNPNAERLPPVVPLVIAQCGVPWTAKQSLRDLVEGGPEFDECTPDFVHLLLDLSTIPSDPGGTAVDALLEVMNAVRVGPAAVIKALEKRAVLLQSLSRTEGGFGLAAVLLLYISQVTDALTFRELATAVRKAQAPELEVYAMTIEQELLKKGHQQGHQQGLEQGHQQGVEEGLTTGLRTAILRVLAVRFPGSAHHEAARLLAGVADEGRLCALQDAALLADSYEEFLRSLTAR